MRNKEVRIYTHIQISRSHKMLQIRSYRGSNKEEVISGGASGEERLLGKGGNRYGPYKN